MKVCRLTKDNCEYWGLPPVKELLEKKIEYGILDGGHRWQAIKELMEEKHPSFPPGFKVCLGFSKQLLMVSVGHGSH